MNDLISRQAAIDILDEFEIKIENGVPFAYSWARMRIAELPSTQPEQQHGRVFKGIVVEYPSYNTYPECKGKPYFSIKYTENGQYFIGFGTYKPEVLSEYLKEYFMPSAQPEREKGKWVEFEYGDHTWHKCSFCGCADKYKDEVKREDGTIVFLTSIRKFCPNCGADMRGEKDG